MTTTTALAVTDEQLDLVRRTIAQGATDAELKLYLYDCARHGVHPLDRLLHFTKRGDRYTPVTSIDLMRMRAHDTGECLGISDAAFDQQLPPPAPPYAAVVTVKRLVQGQVAEFTATARWAEYYPGDAQGRMWKKMPHTMLGKCAEALALRKGFPKQLAGLYAREEMDQADRTEARPPDVELPPPAAPAGYDLWLHDLSLVAYEGTSKLQETWKASKREFREHLTHTDNQKWMDLKAVAVKVKQSEPVSAA
jgi:phage recombination protein Bet